MFIAISLYSFNWILPSKWFLSSTFLIKCILFNDLKNIYHNVGYNNFLHQNTIKYCKKVCTRKWFLPSYYFLNIYLENYVHDQRTVSHVLQYNPLIMIKSLLQNIFFTFIIWLMFIIHIKYIHWETTLNSRERLELFLSLKTRTFWPPFIGQHLPSRCINLKPWSLLNFCSCTYFRLQCVCFCNESVLISINWKKI